MDAQLQLLSDKFERIGARLKVDASVAHKERILVDVRRDRKGEFFLVRAREVERLRLEAIDVRPHERHLLLLAADRDPAADRSLPKQKFLCGHDERAWFVAAVPERRSASGVRSAMEALKPWPVLRSQEWHRVRFEDRNRRRNAGFFRQGEWFFVPEPRVVVNASAVLRNEPLQRTGGKPHWAEFAYRTGGELVYFSPSRNAAITAWQHQRRHRLVGSGPDDWRPMRRNSQVLVTGQVSHPDHKTIHLRGWHRVVMNTEHESEAMRFVAFLD
jgi:hypothetical protein